MPTKPLKEQVEGKRQYKLGKTQNGGRVSNKDLQYIQENWKTKTAAQIQKTMKHRSITFVQNQINKLKQAEENNTEAPLIKGRLETPGERIKRSYEWKTLEQQFTENELEHFVDRYTDYDAQFADRTPSENGQIIQMIKNEIQLDRILIKIKMGYLKVELLENKVVELMEGDMDDDSQQKIQLYEAQMDTIRANETVLAKQQKDHQDFINNTLKSLKSTRDQRLAKVESSTTNFPNLIKLLFDEVQQEIIGDEIARQSLASDLEYKKLSKKHKYDDGEIDRPFLNSETVGMEDDFEEQEISGPDSAKDEGLELPANEGVEGEGEKAG